MPTSLTTQDGQLEVSQDGEVLLQQPGVQVPGTSTALPSPAAVLSCPNACADGLYRPRYPFGTTATPTFSPPAGTYTGTQTVNINCPTPKATIYYTTDGSTPTTASPVFSQPITVTANETIQAIATAPSFQPGAVASAAYVITVGTPLALVGPFTLAPASQSTLYQQSLSATGGTPPYTFALNGAPSGSNTWTVNSGGTLSGTPINLETDSIPVIVTDSLGATATGSYSVTVNSTAFGPADFYVTLQGETAQGSSTYRPTPGDPSYNVPNAGAVALGWPDSPPNGSNAINHYEIQRTSDGGTTWAYPTGGASISTAAANAQGTRFTDTTASNAVGSTYGPDANGQYLTATVYGYRLRAVDSQGIASAWVTGAKQYIYNGLAGGASVVSPSGSNTHVGGGFKWTGDLSSGYPTNYAVSDPTYGFVATIDMTAATGGYFLPTTGCNYCTFNQQVGDCDFLYFVMKSTNAAPHIGMHAEVVGDHPMPSIGLVDTYVQNGPIVANQYMTYKIPLNQLQVPGAGFTGSASAIGVQQKAFYKFLWQASNATVLTIQKAWFGK